MMRWYLLLLFVIRCWLLVCFRQVKGGEDWSALSDIKSVHVAVTANAEVIPYTSLRKDAIAHREVKQAQVPYKRQVISLWVSFTEC